MDFGVLGCLGGLSITHLRKFQTQLVYPRRICFGADGDVVRNRNYISLAGAFHMPIPHGIRQTQTVTDENDGKEAVVTDEYWYS
jgi:hypothetical protein